MPFPWALTRTGFTGSNSSHMFNCIDIENSFPIHNQYWYANAISSTMLPTLDVFCIFHLSLSGGHMGAFYCDLLCISIMTKLSNFLFPMLLGILWIWTNSNLFQTGHLHLGWHFYFEAKNLCYRHKMTNQNDILSPISSFLSLNLC